MDNSSELSLNFLQRKQTDLSLQLISFDPKKASSHDMISIHMLKLCGKPVCKPLNLIFQSCMRQGKFPTEWKKASVVPLHKKRDKQILKDYRPVSSLPICEKIFERFICNNIFEYFIENDFISQTNLVLSQTLCINQLISTNHEICQSLKSDEFFLTYPRLLIKFGMKVLFIN